MSQVTFNLVNTTSVQNKFDVERTTFTYKTSDGEQSVKFYPDDEIPFAYHPVNDQDLTLNQKQYDVFIDTWIETAMDTHKESKGQPPEVVVQF
tara:strand:+ start:323 stop:601 length:279 start_codon:yes stop_codon:yes gene_type:complete